MSRKSQDFPRSNICLWHFLVSYFDEFQPSFCIFKNPSFSLLRFVFVILRLFKQGKYINFFKLFRRKFKTRACGMLKRKRANINVDKRLRFFFNFSFAYFWIRRRRSKRPKSWFWLWNCLWNKLFVPTSAFYYLWTLVKASYFFIFI